MSEALEKVPQEQLLKLQEIRQKVLSNNFTLEDIKEGIQLLSLSYASRYTVQDTVAKTKTSRIKTPKQTVSLDSLLADL